MLNMEGVLMSVKTLNDVQAMVLPATGPVARTYSIAPTPAMIPEAQAIPSAALDSFLEAENPLGCIRGVMWVMAFNAAVVLMGVAIWQCCKFLL
jgi:hypothetical protein